MNQRWREVAGSRPGAGPALVPRWSREPGHSAGIRGQRRL